MGVPSYDSLDVRRAMFSEPLAYSSTLDQRPPVARPRDRRPTWRSFGARVSHTRWKIRRLKLTPYSSGHSVLRAEKSFSLRRGLNSDLRLLQAEHHLSFDNSRSPPETTKATRWVALDWLGCG
jgi:hypothetical protein